MDPFMLRTQLERNNADLEQYSRELTEWSTEMKEKEGGLLQKNKRPKKEFKKKVLVNDAQEEDAKSSPKILRHGRGDYVSWEKYDADKECERLDNEKTISAADYDDVSDETDEEYIEESVIEKDKGNVFFKANDFTNAIKCYNRAIDLYAYNPIYFANRAMCYLKLDNYEKAESDCTLALHLDKKYVKAYQRRAIARENLNKLIEAKEDILRVFDFEPSNKESKDILKRLEGKMKKSTVKQNKTEHVKTSKIQAKDEHEFARPKSKFALSRQQNKDIKTSYSPSNLLEPISDKVIERKIDLSRPSTSQLCNDEKNEINRNITENHDVFFTWPKHESQIIEYAAIKKSPKIRSQTALKKIKVSETEGKNSINATPEKKIDAVNINNVQNETESFDKNEQSPKQATKSAVLTNSDELDAIILREIPTDDFSKLLNRPIPKTCIQFYYNWKGLNSELKYLFLLQIDPKAFVNIFKDSLESTYFSEMLKIMAEEFVPRNKTVVPHLYGLSKVKRFSTLIMFKTVEDKSVLNVLMDNIQQDKDFAKFIDLLKMRYEMD